MQNKPYKVSFQQLFMAQAVVTLGFVLVAFDQALFSGEVKKLLPDSIDEIFWYNIVFFLPHVVFSHLIVCLEPGYFREFRSKYLISIVLVALTFVIAPHMGKGVFEWLAMSILYNHLLQQQVGLLSFASKRRTVSLKLYKILIVAIAFIGSGLFVPEPDLLFFKNSSYVSMASVPLLAGILISAIFLHRQMLGQWEMFYLWSGVSMAVGLFFFAATGYGFIWVAASRVTHDWTAWLIYSAHHRNRAAAGFGIPLLKKTYNAKWHTPLLAVVGICLALPLTVNYKNETMGVVASFLVMLHFFSEHWLWRKNKSTHSALSFISKH